MHVYAAVRNNTFYTDEIPGFKNIVEWTWDDSSLHRLILVVVSRLQIPLPLLFVESVVSPITDFRIIVFEKIMLLGKWRRKYAWLLEVLTEAFIRAFQSQVRVYHGWNCFCSLKISIILFKDILTCQSYSNFKLF